MQSRPPRLSALIHGQAVYGSIDRHDYDRHDYLLSATGQVMGNMSNEWIVENVLTFFFDLLCSTLGQTK